MLLILGVICVWKTSALSCPEACPPEDEVDPPTNCEGGYGLDVCGCPWKCKKVLGEQCQGEWGELGECDDGLECSLPNSTNNSLRVGTCVQKPEVARSCGYPDTIENGFRLMKPTTPPGAYQEGDKVVYVCNPGFRMIERQNRERTCQRNGTWSGSTLPVCKESTGPKCLYITASGKCIKPGLPGEEKHVAPGGACREFTDRCLENSKCKGGVCSCPACFELQGAKCVRDKTCKDKKKKLCAKKARKGKCIKKKVLEMCPISCGKN